MVLPTLDQILSFSVVILKKATEMQSDKSWVISAHLLNV